MSKQLAPIDHFKQLLQAMQPELAKALMDRVPVEYFSRVLLTTVQKTPALLECTPHSMLAAITESAQLGLLPDGVTGYGYLVPRWNGKIKAKEAQFQPGYKGLVQLAYRGGNVDKISAREVRENDEFQYSLGTEEYIDHRPASGNRGELTYFYAVAFKKDRDPIFVVLENSRVQEIRERTKRQNNGKDTPSWKHDYVAMGRKTAVRELFRWLPLDYEAHRVAAQDEQTELGEREVDAEVRDPVSDMQREMTGGGEPEPEPEPEPEKTIDVERTEEPDPTGPAEDGGGIPEGFEGAEERWQGGDVS